MSNTRDTGFLRNAIQVTDQGVTFVSGSTTLMSISSSGAVTTTGVISGSNALSASFSLNSALLNGTGSVGFTATASFLAVSSSQQQISSSQQQISASLLNVVANYATTGSNSFRANQSITGSLVVSSTITAQTLVVQTVTSSIVYSSGSNIFGSALGDRQTFTGSLQVTGSQTVFGNVGIGTINPTTKLTIESSTYDDFIKLTRTGAGSMGISATNPRGIQTTDAAGSFVGLHVSASGFVGIGATDPVKTLDVRGTLAISNNASSYWYMDRSDDDGRFKILTDGNSEKFSIAATGVAIFSGSVGIGAVTPSVLLNTFLNDDLTTIQIRAESNTSAVVTYTGLGSSVLEYYRNIATGVDLTIQTKIVSSGGGGNIVFSPNSPSVNLTPVERMRITKDGNVGIGTTTPTTTLSVKGAGANGILLDQDAASVNASSRLFFKMSTQTYTILADNNGLNFMSGATAGSSSGDVKITMNSAGSVGIGTTTPAFTLDVSGTGRFTSTISSTTSTTGATIKLGGFTNYGTIQDANDVRRIWFENVGSYRTIFDLPTSGTSFAFRTNDGTSILSLTSAGDATFNGTIQTTGMTVARNVVGDPADLRVRNNNTGGYPSSIAWSIYGYAVSAGYFDQFRIQASYPGYGLTNFLVKYQPNSSEVAAIQIRGEGYVRVNGPVSGMDGSSANFQVNGFSRMGQIIMHNPSNTAQAVSLNCSGADTFYINGALSKNSGSFRIRHPLASKKSTHQLVHSFIEGPKADLIYRGKIRLAAGRATVNMDEAATMTEGTFEALCREVQCFTSNESGWDLTKGTVEGNILTIESQNTESTEEISWLVIGERHDEHMMNTDWTDSNGRVIVEPLAPEENNIF